jgi:uncharacterized RDD family membrane protein YckC
VTDPPTYIGVLPRAAAVLIDGFLLALVARALTGSDAPAEIAAGNFVLTLVYYTSFEALRGQTIGKSLVGIRVVKEDGSPVDWRAAAIRNALRIVDWLIAYLLAAFLVARSPKRQRLGDMAAGTVVVPARPRAQQTE